MADEKYRSLESRIRDVARAGMQKKIDEHNAKIKLTTKILEEPKPEIKEELEPVEELSTEKLKDYVNRTGVHRDTKYPKLALKKIDDRKETKEETIEPEPEPIEELAPAQDPMKAKMDAQRQQVQKQKDQLRMQLAQQKAAKQMQAAKEKGTESLEKIKEDDAPELNERAHGHVRTFHRATRLEKLHSSLYNRLLSSGDLAKAEAHRKKSAEYKRLAYFAKDNPDKLPS